MVSAKKNTLEYFQPSAGEVIWLDNGNCYNNLMKDNDPDYNENEKGKQTKRLY